MRTFFICAETASEATVADFASTYSRIRTGGGTDIAVFRNAERERPHAEFSMQARDRNQAFVLVARLLVGLTDAAPLLIGGWVLVSITPGR